MLYGLTINIYSFIILLGDIMNFEDMNFDIKSYISSSDLDGLNRVKIYLDYALNTTIRKQMPEINFSDEKLYAKELLRNYLKGDMHSFTGKNNIRNNIYTIGNELLIKLFLKCMIEKHAYNTLIRKIEGSNDYNDQCCNYITNLIGRKHYGDIVEWLNNDFNNIEEIINNYINIYYQRNFEECSDLQKLAFKGDDTKKAMEVIDLI